MKSLLFSTEVLYKNHWPWSQTNIFFKIPIFVKEILFFFMWMTKIVTFWSELSKMSIFFTFSYFSSLTSPEIEAYFKNFSKKKKRSRKRKLTKNSPVLTWYFMVVAQSSTNCWSETARSGTSRSNNSFISSGWWNSKTFSFLSFWALM